MDSLPQNDQFIILLHKKIMNKTGSAKRRTKKYYMDQYRKTGIIPKALFLAGSGVMEGRKCSGRKRALDEPVIKRFVDMVKASSNRHWFYLHHPKSANDQKLPPVSTAGV